MLETARTSSETTPIAPEALELAFAPLHKRAFGMAVALNEQQLYRWDEFRERLVAEIAAAEASGATSSYYERWLASFERLLVEKGVLGSEEIEARTAEFASGQREEVY